MIRTITVLPANVTPTVADWNDIVRYCDVLKPWTLMRMWKISDGPPPQWKFKVEFTNGKVWQQDMTFVQALDPERTFPNGPWALSETIGIRELMIWLVGFRDRHALLDSVKYEITA